MPDSSATTPPDPRTGTLEAFAPTDGWWVVYESRNGSYFRRKVAGWGTYRTSRGLVVAPMTAFVTTLKLRPEGLDGGDLWHDGQSYCGCHRSEYGQDTTDTDDIYWCDTCAGEIPR
jgi:hypothetical protein